MHHKLRKVVSIVPGKLKVIVDVVCHQTKMCQKLSWFCDLSPVGNLNMSTILL